jgi:hypothetical protein
MFRSASLLVGMIFLCGCGTMIHPLTPAQRLAVQAGTNSIVLLRITGEENGSPLPFKTFVGKLVARMHIIDEPEQLRTSGPWYRTSSPESASNGWIYLVLSPGDYYFTIGTIDFGRFTMPYTGFFTNHFEVPPGKSLLYAGSMHINFPSRVAGWTEKWTEENSEAQTFGASAFPGFGAVETIRMLPFNRPARFVPLKELSPMAVTLNSSASFITPDWTKYTMAKHQVIGDSAVLAMSSGAAAAIIYDLFYAPIANAIAKESARKEAAEDFKKWEPGMNELREFVRLNENSKIISNVMEHLTRRGMKAVAPLTINGTREDGESNGAKNNLRATILSAGLVPAGKLKEFVFSVVAVVQVQMRDAGGQSLFDGIYLYSTPRKVRYAAPPYLNLLNEEHPARKLPDYCEPEGRLAVLKELSTAVSLAVQNALTQVTQGDFAK